MIGKKNRLSAILIACLAGLFLITGTVRAAESGLSVLVIDRATGYYHESKVRADTAMAAMGIERGWTIVFSDSAEQLTESLLSGFDVVVFNNTNALSADRPILNDGEKAAFVSYIQGGGGYVGIHGAANPGNISWDWYVDLVGCIEGKPSYNQVGHITVEIPDDVSTAHLPLQFDLREEYWPMTRDVRTVEYMPPEDNIEVLLSAETDNFQAGHPVSWRHTFQGGRSWYLAVGHNDTTFANPLILNHLAGGIEWAGSGNGAAGSSRRDLMQVTGRRHARAGLMILGGSVAVRKAAEAVSSLEFLDLCGRRLRHYP